MTPHLETHMTGWTRGARPFAGLVGALLVCLPAAGSALAQTRTPAGDTAAWLPVPTPVRYVVDGDGARRLAPTAPDGEPGLQLKVLRLEADVFPTLVAVRGDLELAATDETPTAHTLGLLVPDYRTGAPLQEVAIRVNDQPAPAERQLVAATTASGPVVQAWRTVPLDAGLTGDVRVTFRYAVVLTGGDWSTCGRHGKDAVLCHDHPLHIGLSSLSAYQGTLGPRDVTVRLHGVERRWVLADAGLSRDARSAASAKGLVATDVNETTLRWSLPAAATAPSDLNLRMAVPALAAADMLGTSTPYEVKALSPALQLWDRVIRFGAGQAPAVEGESDPLSFLRPTRAQWRSLVEELKNRAEGGAPDSKALAEGLLADLYHAAAWQAAGKAPGDDLDALPAPDSLSANARRTLRWIGGNRTLKRVPGPPWKLWDGGAPEAKSPAPPEHTPWHIGTALQRFPEGSALHQPLPALEAAAEQGHLTLLIFFVVPGVLLLGLLIVLIVRARRQRRRAG